MGLFQVLAYVYILLFVGSIAVYALRQSRRVQLPYPAEQFLTNWGSLLFWGMVSGGLIVLLGALLQRQPSLSEGFQSDSQQEPTPSVYVDLTTRVRAAIDRIEEDVGTLSDIGDQTCSLVKEVEEAYAGAKAGDVPEAEYALPKETQAERRTARMARARQQFLRQRTVYHQLKSKTPVLECFQSGGGVAATDEAELQAAAAELQTLLENEQVVASIEASEQVGIALQFTNAYLNKSLPPDTTSTEGFQPSDAATLQVSTGALRGQALISHTIQLLNRENVFHTQVQRLRDLAGSTRERVDAQYSRVARLDRGDIQIADVRDGLRAPR